MQSSSLFESGDPTVRSWFLVSNGYIPLISCILYIMVVKRIGPLLMKNRKPFDIRPAMIVYNFLVVFTYLFVCIRGIYLVNLPHKSRFLCEEMNVATDSRAYKLATLGWILYVLKYVEFIDTVFFVLRKKDHLITNLHVIHHSSLPIISWCFARAETNGFQGILFMINTVVHIIMYFYYGMAAIGPSAKKYLWWKKYLTELQMLQFVLMLITVGIVGPLMGCKITTLSIIIDVTIPIMFFFLFYNYYRKTFFQRQTKEFEKKS